MIKNNDSNSTHILLFGENIKNYALYRPKYPNLLFESISKNIIGKKIKAIDVGAGTGISSIQLTEYFDEVIAVEPDRKLAGFMKETISNEKIEIIEGDFNSLEIQKEGADIINCSSSFHWLNVNKFFEKSEFSLRRGGAVSINMTNMFPVFENELHQKIALEFNEVWIHHCHPNLDCLIDLNILIKRITNISNFSKPLRTTIDNLQILKVDEIIGFFSSLSYFDSYIKTLGEKGKLEYLKRLQGIFEKHSQEGEIKVNFQIHSFQLLKN